MEELTTLFVYTRWRQSHKWTVGEDGLVEYRDERIPPSEVLPRFIVDYPMFDVIRAEVCQRINTGEAVRYPYRWIELERFA